MKEPLPYPPSPDDVPDDYTDRDPGLVQQEWLLLGGLMIFLIFYFSLILLFGFTTLWMILNIGSYHIFAVAGLLFFGTMFFMLAKSLFQRAEPDFISFVLELKRVDQPRLYAFVRRVCEEVGADEPRRICVIPDVNAAAVTPVGLQHLFVQPHRDLYLGLGLINAMNLSEFKGVIAHELGHFTQGGFTRNYIEAVRGIIINIFRGSSWVDVVIEWLKVSGPLGAAIGYPLGFAAWLPRQVLFWIFQLICFGEHKLMKANEFHADRVGTSVAGSDAMVHGLFKSQHAADFFGFALDELHKAADHKMYTADIYFHQHAAAEIYRKKKRQPKKGILPPLDAKRGGEKVQIFDPDDEEDLSGTDGDYHPSNYDREENAKADYVFAPIDERSPWLLFDNPAEIRERMTHKFYRVKYEIGKRTEMTDPRKVQKFIDEENAETTYDAKYEGSYDNRIIDPGDLDELNDLIKKEPWPDDRLATVYQKLYTEIGDRGETRKELMKEYDSLIANDGPHRGRKAKRLLKEVEAKLDKSEEWFHSLDRRAYLVFVQMAYRVSNEAYYDLINRYRFHMAIQGMYKAARMHQGRAHVMWNLITASNEFEQDDFIELMHVLREGRSALRKIIRNAKDLDMPAMKNFEEGDRLADFLLDEEIVKELPETYVKGKWVGKLMWQLDQVMNKSARLHGKSLGGILRLQEEIAVKFLAKLQPAEPVVARPVVAQAIPLSPPPV